MFTTVMLDKSKRVDMVVSTVKTCFWKRIIQKIIVISIFMFRDGRVRFFQFDCSSFVINPYYLLVFFQKTFEIRSFSELWTMVHFPYKSFVFVLFKFIQKNLSFSKKNVHRLLNTGVVLEKNLCLWEISFVNKDNPSNPSNPSNLQ